MARDIIEDILTVSLIIVLFIIIFMLIWRIFGDSPTILDLITTMMVGLVLYIIKIENSRGKFKGRFETFVHYTKESFSRVKEDISNLRNDIKENIKDIKTDITVFKKEIKEDISKLRKEIKK